MSSIYDLLGKVDNLNDPVPILNRTSTIYGLVLSLLALSSLCVLGRLWIRFFITHSPGWDDLFVVLAVLSNVVQAVGLFLAIDNGLGKHFLLLSIEGMQEFIRTDYIANGAYPTSSTFIKLALLLQYLRIFEQSTKSRIITLVAIAVVCLWGFAFSFLAWVPSIPVQSYWDFLIPDSQATRYGYGSHDPKVFVATYVANATTNMTLDLIILAIPISLWMDRDIKGKTRIALFGIFVLGATANVCSIIRLVSIIESKGGTYPTLDPSWYGCTPVILSALEVNISTLCASLPVYWPVFKDHIGMILVTHEVKITRETRDTGDFSILNGSGELYSLEPITPRGKRHEEDDYIRARVDPLHETKTSKTTVLSRGRSQKSLGRELSLDLGSNLTAGLAGPKPQRLNLERRGSKVALLNE